MKFLAAVLSAALLVAFKPASGSAQATPPPSPGPSSPSPAASPVPSPAPSITPGPAAAPLVALPVAADHLHPGETQTVSIQNASGALAASLDTPVVSIAIDQSAHTLSVTGTQQTGRATLVVSDSTGAAVSIPVRVAYDAGTLAANVIVRVTGTQLDDLWLQGVIGKAIHGNTQLQPGATEQIVPYGLPALAPGSTAAIPITVQLSGGTQYYDVSATANIDVENVQTGVFAPLLLFYDDDPEKIVANGILFRGRIDPAAPARLYYYHQDTLAQRHLYVVLSAASQSSTVQIIDASAGPNVDVMSVGHVVSRDFLVRKPKNEGIVVDVSAGNPFLADSFFMNPLDGAAGSIGLRVISGGPVDATVVAAPATMSEDQVAAALAQPQLPGDGHHRTGTFGLSGYADAAVAYTVGGPDATLMYGGGSPPAATAHLSGHDYGEYGVLRLVAFTISNPSAQAATLYLFEQPLGGVVRSSFLVDGTLQQLGCARLANRYEIGPPLAVAGSSQTQITLQTMTDGGSNYPLEVGLTTTPPLVSTPAITAPDGCFPKIQGVPAALPAPEPTGRAILKPF